MERRIGKSTVTVTPLGFGGGTIGSPQVSNQDGEVTVAAAWNTGVRFFDTAPWYGLGRSERRLGLALSGIGDRANYRINTKVGKTLVPEPERDDQHKTLSPGGAVRTPRDPVTGFRVHFDYSQDAILRQHEDSLQRLGHARVDSLTIHDIDYGYHDPTQIDLHLQELSRNGGGGARALEDLRSAGRIGAIGCGCNLESRNAFSWEDNLHEDLIERIADLVDLDFLVVAGGYTLLETRALRRVMVLCQTRGIGVVIAAPYASGWLVSPETTRTYMYAPAPPWVIEKSERMKALATEFEVPLAAVALQFPLAHPSVCAVIPGARSAAEARQNADLARTPIPAELWSRLKAQGLLDEGAPVPTT